MEVAFPTEKFFQSRFIETGERLPEKEMLSPLYWRQHCLDPVCKIAARYNDN
jgi:hypothetical protein